MSKEKLWLTLNFLIGLVILSLTWIGLYLAADVDDYIDLHEVVVPNFVEGTEPEILVFRDLKKSFSGGYSVSVRKNGTFRTYCATGNIDIDYTVKAEKGPEDDVWKLHKWIEGGTCTDVYFEPGFYVINSCHYKDRFYLGLVGQKKDCNNWSNVFEVYADANRIKE